MLAKCANPACPTQFHYLREGRVFLIEFEPPGGGEKRPRRLEHFWLCGPCSEQLTLRYRRGEGVVLVPREATVEYARAS